MSYRPLLALLGFGVAAAVGCTATVYEPQPSPPPPPGPAAEVEPAPANTGDASFFYGSLAPYGSWITVASYGTVWAPRVSPWWRPYSEGRWVFTDDGWTWASSEPWGWAVFHYGRWFDDPEYGWAWVPGRVWGPAWVAWRSGGGQIGWAPLPPSVRWQAGIGFSGGGIDFDAVISPRHWCFVPERDIAAPAIRGYLAPAPRNVTLISVTRNITNYTVINNRIVNNSINVTRVEEITHRSVPRYRIVDRESPTAWHAGELQGNEVAMVRHVEALRTATGVEGRPAVRGSAPPRPAMTSNVETVEQVNRRYQLEQQELARHQSEERARLQRLREADRTQAQPAAAARSGRGAEEKALEAEQRHQAEVLAKRHQLEVNAAKRRVQPKVKPKPGATQPRRTDGPNPQHQDQLARGTGGRSRPRPSRPPGPHAFGGLAAGSAASTGKVAESPSGAGASPTPSGSIAAATRCRRAVSS